MSNEEPPRHSSTGTTGRAAYPPDNSAPGHAETNHARAGETRHIVRYILGASLLLVVLLMAAVLLWGDSKTPDGNQADSWLNQSEAPGMEQQPENMRNKAPKSEQPRNAPAEAPSE